MRSLRKAPLRKAPLGLGFGLGLGLVWCSVASRLGRLPRFEPVAEVCEQLMELAPVKGAVLDANITAAVSITSALETTARRPRRGV